MAANILLKIEGVTGESKIDGYEGQIDVLSSSIGVSNATSVHFGGGAGTAKCNIQDLTITKRVDCASPDLFLKTCTGEHYDKATLTFLKSGGDNNVQVPYLIYDMTEVYVSSWHQSGGGDAFANEGVSLSFGMLMISYAKQNDDGSQGDVAEITFDIAKNKKV